MSLFKRLGHLLSTLAPAGVGADPYPQDFSPPICPACGAGRPVSPEPCAQCGIPGDVFRWQREPPTKRSRAAWTTSHEALGIQARVYPTEEGGWWGQGSRSQLYTMPLGGPWAAVDERDGEAMGAFCAWLCPDRPRMQWPDTVAARCTLLALTLGALGLVELQLVETNSFGRPGSGAPRFTTGACLLPGGGVEVSWARKSLELLAERCDILKARYVSTTEWLDAVLHFGPIPTREPTPPGARLDAAAFPSDPKVRKLARMIHVGVAGYQDP